MLKIKRICSVFVAFAIASVISLTILYAQNQNPPLLTRTVVVQRQPNQLITPPTTNEVETFDTSNAPEIVKARRIADFRKGRDLLVQRGFLFEPYLLLEGNWRSRLAAIAGRVPELQTVRRSRNRLSGVQFARTLTIPANVQLTGDTVIIADRVIYEGSGSIPTGSYKLYIFDNFLDR